MATAKAEKQRIWTSHITEQKVEIIVKEIKNSDSMLKSFHQVSMMLHFITGSNLIGIQINPSFNICANSVSIVQQHNHCCDRITISENSSTHINIIKALPIINSTKLFNSQPLSAKNIVIKAKFSLFFHFLTRYLITLHFRQTDDITFNPKMNWAPIESCYTSIPSPANKTNLSKPFTDLFSNGLIYKSKHFYN